MYEQRDTETVLVAAQSPPKVTALEEPPAVDTVEQKKDGQSQAERLLAAKSAILRSIVQLVITTALSCFVCVVSPTYILGAYVGPLASAEGLPWVAFYFVVSKLSVGWVFGRYVQESTFASVIKDTDWRLSPGWRCFWL